MADLASDPGSASPETRKRRGCFGLATKTVLGCAAFSLGAIVVLIACLPTLCEGLARSVAEKGFAKACRGSLEIADVDLSWSGAQRIQDAVLRDPEGKEVARVSAVLPSLLEVWRMRGPMRVDVALDADLSADDAGLTNLQRAIEPRQPRADIKDDDHDTEGSDPLAQISRLDVEARLTSRRLAWSDAETRRRGRPFEVRDLAAALVLKPGHPITLRATAQVVSDEPGALDIESTIHGPIEIGKSWPLGPVDARVRIEKFSTAMVDGVADLRGKLVEVVGPTFDLKIDVAGATPEQGGLDLDFSSARTNLAFSGSFEGGLLRTKDGSPVRLTLGVPKGFVNELLAPALPPDVTVSWEEGDRPWTVTVANLALPIPDAAAKDGQAIARTFDHLVADVAIDLPARVKFESAETRAANIQAAIDGLTAQAHVAPGDPATVKVETRLETGTTGRIAAQATVQEPWKALASGAMPVVDGDLVVEGISTRAIDALAGQGGRIATAIGPSIAVHVEAREASASAGRVTASVQSERLNMAFRGALEGGALRCTGEDGLDFTWDPPAGFVDAQLAPLLPPGSRVATARGRVEVRAREVTAPVATGGRPWTEVAKAAACDLRGSLPGATWTTEGAAKVPPFVLGKLDWSAKLVPGGAANLSLAMPLEAGAPGKIAVEASTQNAFLGLEAPLEANVTVEGVATAPIDALAGQEGRLARALGPTVSVQAHAVGSGAKLAATTEVKTDTLNLRAAVEKEGDLVRATGDQGVTLTAGSFAPLLPFLPPGASLTHPAGSPAVELTVREISARLPSGATAGATPAAIAETLACELSLKLGALAYADAHTAAAKVDLAVRDLALTARVAPKKALAANVAATVSTSAKDEGGRLEGSVGVPDPWFFLRGPDAKLPPLDADVRFAGLPVALVDGLSGRPGIATGLLGARADLEVKAAGASADAGTFRAKISSPTATIAVAARLEKGSVVAIDEPALDLDAAVSQAWIDALLGPRLPAGARVALVDAKQHLRARVGGLRWPLAGGAAGADVLKNASLKAELSLPDLAYSDGKTPDTKTPAKAPATVRDLKITADVAPDRLPSAVVGAKVEGEPAGEIRATVRALDPPALLSEPDGAARFRVAAEVNAKSVPTGLVDALAGQDGLLVDVLGATIDLQVHSEGISQTAGTFTADFQSPQAKVVVDRGGMKDRVLFLEKLKGKDEALLARTGLTPLFTQRIVGNLVPMIVDLKKPQGADPAVVSVDELRLPLDADLSKLDAVVRVNLGEVSYRLLPGLESLLGGAEAKTVKLPEIRVPIEKGVASYSGLPVHIAGRDYMFQGTFNLVDKSFRMQTQVPLSALGKKVSDQLDTLRGVLDPNMMVPLELRGTWKSPKLRVGDDFLKKVAEDALKKQGGGLLDGLLKKKKN